MDAAAALDELQGYAEMRHRDPEAALRLTRLILDSASGEPVVEARGHWVLGLAQHQLGHTRAAVRSYRAAVRLAAKHSLADTESVARASMAISLLSRAKSDDAEAAISDALAVAPEPQLGFVELLHGLMLQRSGRLDDALVVYQRAGRLLRAPYDGTSALALLELNLGTLLAYRATLTAPSSTTPTPNAWPPSWSCP